MYSKTSLNLPSGDRFELVHLGRCLLLSELEYRYNRIVWMIVWDPNKAIGQLESFTAYQECPRVHIYTHIYIYIYMKYTQELD